MRNVFVLGIVVSLLIVVVMGGLSRWALTPKAALITPPGERLTQPTDQGLFFPANLVPVFSRSFSPALQKRSLDATCRVSDPSASGTGTVIGRDADGIDILTAEHVIDEGPPYRIDFEGSGRSYSDGIEVLARSKKSDLALLRLRTTDAMPDPIRVCPPTLKLTSPFDGMTVGCNGPKSIQFTRVAQVYKASSLSGNPWLLVDPTARGRSGGPLIDEHGFVVGVCCQFGPDQRGVYQGPDEIYCLLDDANKTHLYTDESVRPLRDRDFAEILLRLLVIWFLAAILERSGGARARGAAWLPLLLLVQPFVLYGLRQYLFNDLSLQQSFIIITGLSVLQLVLFLVARHAGNARWSGSFCVLPVLAPVFALAFHPHPIVTAVVALGYYIPLAARSWVGVGEHQEPQLPDASTDSTGTNSDRIEIPASLLSK